MDISIAQKKLKLASPGDQNLIDNLPDECIQKIFGFLLNSQDRCNSAAVSKKWLHLMASMRVSGIELPEQSPSHHPQPFSRWLMGEKANDIRLAALAVRAYPPQALTFLCIMGLPRSSSVTDIGLEIIAKTSSSLKCLSLWDCDSVRDMGFQAIAKWCRDLERLNLINLPLISDNALRSIASSCAELSALSIESCPLIGGESFEIIGKKCLKLKAVSLVKCPSVQDSGIISLISNLPELLRLKISMMRVGNEVLKAILSYGKTLQVLHLEKIKGPTEMSYSQIGAMEELKSLKLRLCTGLTGESFKGSKFTGLKSIDIRRCISFTDEVLIELSESAKLLKCLRLEESIGFSSKGLLQALRNWRDTLKILSLNKCWIIENQVITKPEDFLLLNNYPLLSTLELRDCNGISDEFLSWMALSCNQAKQISLTGMSSFSDQGLLRLLMFQNAADNLVSLELSGCRTVSDQALNVVVKGLGSGLKYVKLENCSGVSDKIMKTIAAHCVVLEELKVDGCGITDISLWCLVFKGKDRLRSLSIAGCTGISDLGLECLEQMRWDNLKMLNIRNCPRISSQSIEFFREWIWWCKVIY